MKAQQKKLSINVTNLLVDSAIFAAFLIALDPRLTGVAIHEWLSLAAAGTLIVHLLLHWQWIGEIIRRFFRRLAGQARLNAIVNALFFIDFTVVVFSGLMISEAVLPALGLQLAHSMIWRQVHTLTADVAVYILGLHVALHWKWILTTIKRSVIQPLIGGIKGKQPVYPSALAGQEAEK